MPPLGLGLHRCLRPLAHTLTPLRARSSAVQAVTGGKATYFGAEIPFDLNTLTGIVSGSRRGEARLMPQLI